MTFREAAAAIGVEKYPEALDAVLEEAAGKLIDICDIPWLQELDATYGVLGEFKEEVLQGAQAVKNDPARYCWGNTVATYLHDRDMTAVRSVPTPASDETPAGDMLPLLIMLTMVPDMVRDYRKRGADEEKIQRYLKHFQGNMKIVRTMTGRLGINQLYFNWTMLYVKAMIFDLAGFNFEMKKFPGPSVYLKNRETGALACVMQRGTFHRSGMMLGAAGFADEEGSFAAEFEETEDSYCGYEAVDGLVIHEKKVFPKAQWECFLRGGEYVLGMHIPRKTDISGEAFNRAVAAAREFADKYYPEYKPMCLHCSSWLLDPTLAEIVGKDAKISQFGAQFTRHPNKSAGREVYTFVFPPRTTDLNTIPETSRLLRGLKQRYLEGRFAHAYSGIHLF